jgi:hypothetical protein
MLAYQDVSGKCHTFIPAKEAEHLGVLVNLGGRKSCHTVVDLRMPFQTSVFGGLELIPDAAQ